MRYALDPGSSRPRLGPFGGPLFGVRAVAEAAGLDGSEVMALLRAGHGDVVVAMVSARYFDQLERARAAKRPAGRR